MFSSKFFFNNSVTFLWSCLNDVVWNSCWNQALDSFWLGDAIWWQRTGSILAQVLTYCLAIPNCLPEPMLTKYQRDAVSFTCEQFAQEIDLWYKFENYQLLPYWPGINVLTVFTSSMLNTVQLKPEFAVVPLHVKAVFIMQHSHMSIRCNLVCCCTVEIFLLIFVLLFCGLINVIMIMHCTKMHVMSLKACFINVGCCYWNLTRLHCNIYLGNTIALMFVFD